MTVPLLVSIQVGQPRFLGTDGAVDPMDRPWATGFFKEPIPGPVRVTQRNVVGDGQADLVNHGGIDKAVLIYSAEHYPYWCAELGLDQMPFGAFGENLTISGLTEHDVNIGDVWKIGEVLFEVSQPRQPCWKLARRWRIKDLPARVVETGRSGWYLRVRTEGEITPGLPAELIERPNPDWSIVRANRVMYFHKYDPDERAALARVPGLSTSWVRALG